MSERWLPVPGFEGAYEVSDAGVIRSLDRAAKGKGPGNYRFRQGRVLKLATSSRGYLFAHLSHEGRRARVYAHRLVLTVFVGPAPAGMQACHNDGVKTNNALANLRWDTPAANSRDAIAHGQHSGTRRTHCAQGHPFSKANTGVRSTGHRWCRECNRAKCAARYAAQRSAR